MAKGDIATIANQLARSLAEAQTLLGVAIGLEIESSALREGAWQRAASCYQLAAEEAKRLAEECQDKASQIRK